MIYCTTAREIWQDLEEIFSQSSEPQLYSLQQSLHDLFQDSSASVAEFFTQINSIWDEMSAMNPIPICACTGCTYGITKQIFKQQQDERLIQLLMKIDNKYSNVRSNLLMMQPLPNIQLAYRLLSQEEKQRQTSSLTIENMGHMSFAAADQKDKYSVTKGHNGGIKVNSNNKRNYSSTGTFSYDFCHTPGHTKERFYRLHGFPVGYGIGKGYNGKGKKVAAMAHGEIDNDENDVDDEVPISVSQYNHLPATYQQAST